MTERAAERFLTEVRAEWRGASKVWRPLHSPHEAAAVIKEEYDEFWDEVKRKPHDKIAMLQELTQVAAMCVRAVVDLRLSAETNCEELSRP